MNKNHTFLISFILEQAETQPVSKRIQIYRSLSHFCGDSDEAKKLTALADQLTAVEQQSSQFTFTFNQATR